MMYAPGYPSAMEIIGKLSDFMVWAEQVTVSPAICAVVYEFAAEFLIDTAAADNPEWVSTDPEAAGSGTAAADNPAVLF